LPAWPHRSESEFDGGAASGTLLLARVADLAATNRDLGREATDRALQMLARSLTEWPSAGASGARLNGADFALALRMSKIHRRAPVLADALRMALTSVAPSIVAHVGQRLGTLGKA
jgi:GGDEF domain-containing protein